MADTDGKRYDFEIDVDNQQSTYGLAYQLIEKGTKVLDIGCATGNLIHELKKNKDCTVKGIDLDPESVRIAKERGLDVEILDVSKTTTLDKLGSGYDYILLLDIIEHLDYPLTSVIEELKKHLSQHGQILISTPNFQHIDTIARMVHGSFEYQDTGILDKTHKHFYSPRELIKDLWKLGFQCDSIKRIEVPQGRTELALNKPQYRTILSTLEELTISTEKEVYQYVYLFKQKEDRPKQSVDQHLVSLNVMAQDPNQPIDDSKWNIIVRTIGSRIDLLPETLYSIALQTYANKSVILATHLIDGDLSKIKKIENVIKKFEGILEIKLLHADPNKKRGHPMNVALENRDGRYISFLDDDDVYYPNFGETLIGRMQKGGFNFVLANSVQVNMTKVGNHYKTIEKRKEHGEPFNPIKLITNNTIPINTYVIDFDEFQGVRFDENLDVLEDWDFLLELLTTRPIRASYENVSVSEYRHRDDGTNSPLAKQAKNVLPPSLIHARNYIPTKFQSKPFKINYFDAFYVYPDINDLLQFDASNSEFGKLNNALNEKSREVQERQKEIQERRKEVQERQQEIERLNPEIHTLQKSLGEIKSTKFWKVYSMYLNTKQRIIKMKHYIGKFVQSLRTGGLKYAIRRMKEKIRSGK